MSRNLVDWTSKQFEDAKAQVISANLHQIELLASHCGSLDLKNPVHVQVMLVLGWKIRELEEELETLQTISYDRHLEQRSGGGAACPM